MNLMNLWNSVREVVKPSAFKARLHGVTEEQHRLLRTLHLLERPAIEDITVATDKAAEFH